MKLSTIIIIGLAISGVSFYSYPATMADRESSRAPMHQTKEAVRATVKPAVQAASRGSVNAALYEGNGVKAINAQDERGYTALITAVEIGHGDQVKSLLKVPRINVNMQNKVGLTALMLAAHRGDTEIVDLLLAAGAEVNAQDKGGSTALIYAVRNGHKKIADAFMGKDANVNLASREHYYTPIMYAAQNGNTALVKSLFNKGASVYGRDQDGNTVLMHAARGGHHNIVEYLVERGADVNARNKKGKTARMLAKEECYGQRETCMGVILFFIKNKTNRAMEKKRDYTKIISLLTIREKRLEGSSALPGHRDSVVGGRNTADTDEA